MTNAKEIAGQIEYYSRAMKAPRIWEVTARLADQARETGWTQEEYLAAVLSREVAAREASGAEMRARQPGSLPASRSRSSALTTSQVSDATPSRTWPPARSSPKRPRTLCTVHGGGPGDTLFGSTAPAGCLILPHGPGKVAVEDRNPRAATQVSQPWGATLGGPFRGVSGRFYPTSAFLWLVV